jgi:hypothetical protein
VALLHTGFAGCLRTLSRRCLRLYCLAVLPTCPACLYCQGGTSR